MTRLKTIVALVIGTLLATALPAQAQTEYFTDSLNDLRYLADHTEVPAEVAYGTDIRRVKISFNTDRLRIVSRHVDLKASDSNDLVLWVLNMDGDDLPELTIAADDKTFWQYRTPTWYKVDHLAEAKDWRCDGTKQWNNIVYDTMTLRIPSRCLSGVRRVALYFLIADLNKQFPEQDVYDTLTDDVIADRIASFTGYVRKG